MDELRVLLVSPVRGVDPLSGDVTYTEQLLAAPPPGVRYTTYVDALAHGSLRERGSRAAVRAAIRRDLPGELGVALWRKAEHLVRRSGLAFREPLRILAVQPGAFDLVHVHVFHSRFLGGAPPIIMSAGGPLRWLYRDAWGWTASRTAVADAVDGAVGALWDATICGVRRGRARTFIVFSEYFRNWLVGQGWPGDMITVIPNQLDLPATPPRTPRTPRRLGFIAKDFEAKGGTIVLEAFARLRAHHPDLELVVVGSPPRASDANLAARGIRWYPLVPRDRLLSEILPSLDILVYPSFADGLPYGPMEALAAGIPCVVSDYRALPELVGDDAGRVSPVGDVSSVVTAVEELLVPEAWLRASRAAQERFLTRFAAHVGAAALGDVYRGALDDPRSDA